MEQKFVQVYDNRELHITACAVSKMIGIDHLSELEEYKNYFVEPNRKWLENQSDLFAWVKVYYKLIPTTDSIIIEQVQTIKIEMPFFGKSVDECWGEVQINVKRTVLRYGKKIDLELVKFGRHKSFDPRRGEFGEWVEETKPIEPKKERDNLGTHYYISLRLYHQDYLPENQPDWCFESLFVSISGKDFYRIDAVWQKEKITITATPIDGDSNEIPKFLKR